MVMLTFSVLDWKYPIRAYFVVKNQNHLYKLKFGTDNNLIMLNLMVISTFSVLNGKHHFWTNLFQKSKFFWLRGNLVHRLWYIQIFWIWRWLFIIFFSVLDRKYSFWNYRFGHVKATVGLTCLTLSWQVFV